jgi:hypothetical protein
MPLYGDGPVIPDVSEETTKMGTVAVESEYSPG